MKILWATFIWMMLICSCTSSYTVGVKESGAQYEFDEINTRIEKKPCKISFNSGEERKGIGIGCSKDSVSWSEPLTLSRKVVPASQISIVQRTYGKSEALIVSTNGERRTVEGALVTGDSVSWMEPARSTFPTSIIRIIALKNSGAGAVEGLFSGALVGTISGALVLQQLNISFGGTGSNMPAAGYLIFAGGGAVLGALIGDIIGANIGHTDEFFLMPKDDTVEGTR